MEEAWNLFVASVSLKLLKVTEVHTFLLKDNLLHIVYCFEHCHILSFVRLEGSDSAVSSVASLELFAKILELTCQKWPIPLKKNINREIFLDFEINKCTLRGRHC